MIAVAWQRVVKREKKKTVFPNIRESDPGGLLAVLNMKWILTSCTEYKIGTTCCAVVMCVYIK